MSAGAFLIALEKENPEVSRRIVELYPNNYKISDTLFLIADDTLTKTIADKVGVRDNPIENGVVLRLEGSYAGHFPRSLWEWLRKEEHRGTI